MGDGIVYIAASTKSVSTVDYIRIKVHLEKYNGSSWTTVSKWTESNTDSNIVNFKKGVSIIKNQKYRVKALHTVKHNGNSESESTITTYIIPE